MYMYVSVHPTNPRQLSMYSASTHTCNSYRPSPRSLCNLETRRPEAVTSQKVGGAIQFTKDAKNFFKLLL